MSIWPKEVKIEQLNSRNKGTIHESLGIEFTSVGENYLEATMPVDSRTHQPMGLLHGGASVVLAESLGSIASVLVGQSRACVGIEISASHLRAVKEGKVFGRVTPVRLGRSLHVWDIQIREGSDSGAPLVCKCRLTVMIQQSGSASDTK